MQDVISEVHARIQKYIAPFVRFDRVAIEDRPASLAAGRYVAKDVDYAFITPPFSKDEVVKKATAFLEANQQKVELGQMPADVARRFLEQYEAWKNGQELPPDGTPIKGWAMISPAQQAMLIERKILTVELLAQANDEGLRMIGMGGHGMRRMAQTWLEQANDRGPLVLRTNAIEQENAILKGSVDTLTKQVEDLRALVKVQPAPAQPAPSIGLSDILDEEPMADRPKRKR